MIIRTFDARKQVPGDVECGERGLEKMSFPENDKLHRYYLRIAL
jgi:hypothetical protein